MKRSSFLRTALVITLLATPVLVGCGGRETEDWNVLLISIDTLRPDHLGVHGHTRETTPHLDAFAEDAAVFTEAIAQAPSTLPSHASLFTSLLPSEHGASFADRRPLAAEHRTLAEVLRDRDYRTAGFHGGAQVDEVWDLDQGFDVYRRVPTDRFADTVDQALAWLDGAEPEKDEARRPFFLFLHTYEVHHPYTPPAEDLEAVGGADYEGWLGSSVEVRELQRINRGRVGVTAADTRFIQAAYDAEIRSMDRAFGRLLDGLRDRDLYERTIIVFTSDHGEEFGEHGRWGWHAHTLFDELIRVPLVIRLPGDGPRGLRVRRQVRSIDAAPTILDALAVPVPGDFAGVSLLPSMRGEQGERLLAVSQVDLQSSGAPTQSIRSRRWKLYGGRLYDLAEDPGELGDATAGHWDIVAGLQNALAEAVGEKASNLPPIELDDDARERLEALGYL